MTEKKYQYQIDIEDAEGQENKIQQNNEDATANDVFKEKGDESTPSSKKKRGAARLKAKKPNNSDHNLSKPQKRDSVTTRPMSQSTVLSENSNIPTQKIQNISFMNQFTHTQIKKDPNYQSLEKTVANYQKGQEITFSEQQLFKIKKTPKKTRGLFEFITQSAQRFILIERGIIYTLRKLKKDLFIVSSCREFSQLFKIYGDKSEPTELRLCFQNKERDPNKAPIRKYYNFGSSQKVKEFQLKIDEMLKLQGFSVFKNDN